MSAKLANRPVTVKYKDWLDPHTNTRTPVILIWQGPIFIRIPLERAYDLVNRVHDLAEAHERSEQRGETVELPNVAEVAQ